MTKKPLKILVVDDDIDNANSLGELLELEGHEVLVVHSGEDAIGAYLQEQFDLAFMDVMMPGLNGVESFFQIRKLRPQARVYMMTGYSVEELLMQALRHGAMGVLAKPLDISALVGLINEVGNDGIVIAPAAASDYGMQLHNMLTSRGARCRIVDFGHELPQPKADNDVVILDVHASLIDSIGYYRALRSNTHMPPTIIVPSCKNGSALGLEAMRDLGVTGVLNKPFDPQELLLRIDTLIA